jgi:hypothetical protein
MLWEHTYEPTVPKLTLPDVLKWVPIFNYT